MSHEYLIEVEHLKQYFPIRTGFAKTTPLKAVDDISFAIKPGETLGLVGESGCGKTTVGRSLLQLYKPTGGRVKYEGETIFDAGDVPELGADGKPVLGADGKPAHAKPVSVNMLPYRKKMQMVFQDPYSSLNPRMTVEDIIGEPLDVHKLYANKAERREKILSLMELVGLNAEHATRYAHEFSGGQRQRIGIVRALAVSPKVLFCDESVSALDVSVQAQILNLFNELKRKFNLTYVFIGHDLAVIRYISDRILVMYLGKVMEIAHYDQLFADRTHPYTQALVSAIPQPSTAPRAQRILLEGDIPSVVDPPKGCRFCQRCFKAQPRCFEEEPELMKVEEGHYVRCHFVKEAP